MTLSFIRSKNAMQNARKQKIPQYKCEIQLPIHPIECSVPSSGGQNNESTNLSEFKMNEIVQRIYSHTGVGQIEKHAERGEYDFIFVGCTKMSNE